MKEIKVKEKIVGKKDSLFKILGKEREKIGCNKIDNRKK